MCSGGVKCQIQICSDCVYMKNHLQLRLRSRLFDIRDETKRQKYREMSFKNAIQKVRLSLNACWKIEVAKEQQQQSVCVIQQ